MYLPCCCLVVLILFNSIVFAEDFKTVNGKEYKTPKSAASNRTVSVLITKSGISKIYFTELPKEVWERFHYDPQQAAAAPKPPPLNRPKQSTGRLRNSRYENPRPIH